jgi:hypothetical protein
LGAKAARIGTEPTLRTLDLGAIHSTDWAHRFVIAVDPDIADSSLLMYGANFAKLVNLPPKSAPHVPLCSQLPPRLSVVFVRGCDQAQTKQAPVRLEGEIALPDGGRQLYRAAFIPIPLSSRWRTPFTFGAFNSCMAA